MIREYAADTAEKYEYDGEDTGHCWIGVCVGDRVPMARRPLAVQYTTPLDTDHFTADARFEGSPAVLEMVRYASRRIASIIMPPQVPLRPRIPKAIWIEPMGFGDKPDSDDWTAVMDVLNDVRDYEFPSIEMGRGLAACLANIADTLRDRIAAGRREGERE